MIFSGQRTRGVTAVVLAGLMTMSGMLSGCGYTLVSTEQLVQLNASAVNAQEETESEEEPQEEPLQEQQLENQLVSVLNLGAKEDYVATSATLDTAGSFFLDMFLEELQNKMDFTAAQNALQSNIEQLESSCTCVFIYDGALSTGQVGKQALTDIMGKIDASIGYSAVKDLSVSYGTKDKYSAWVILAQYKV